MKFRFFMILLLCFGYINISVGMDLQRPGLYSGAPAFAKLADSLKKTDLFAQAPKPRVKQLDLVSQGASGDDYSLYQIYPGINQGIKTLYHTKETVRAGAGNRFPGVTQNDTVILHGAGVSFGGIFWPLERITAYNRQGKNIYYNKITITSVRPISGRLFPLKAGNDLKFHFSRIDVVKFGKQEKTVYDSGIMEFRVIKRFKNYPYSKRKIPGYVYTIDLLESTQRHPGYQRTEQYDYAPELGWYITDRYFKNGKLLAVYQTRNWK